MATGIVNLKFIRNLSPTRLKLRKSEWPDDPSTFHTIMKRRCDEKWDRDKPHNYGLVVEPDRNLPGLN